MALGTAMAIGAGVGALSGAIGKNASGSQSIDLRDPSQLQKALESGQLGDYNDLRNLINAGPGESDVTAGTASSRDLAELLKQYQAGGYLPNQGDIDSSNKLASGLFNAQRTALNQSFVDQNQQYAQQAAIQGRNPLDAVFRNKQAFQQENMLNLLQGQQSDFANQYALNQPMQRLGFAQQRAGVLGGLASQAMANRQALLGIGSNLLGNERNYQVATSNKNYNQSQGGGLGGAIDGGLAGLGAGARFESMFPGGGGSSSGGPLTLGSNSAMNFFNQSNYPAGAPQAQNPTFSPFTGAGSAPVPTFPSGPRSFSLGKY